SSILIYIELKPFWTRCLREYLLHRRVRQRTQNKQGPCRLRRFCRRDLSCVARQSMKRRWRYADRYRDRLSENRRAEFARADSGQHFVIKFEPLPSCRVFPQRDLIERAAFVISDYILRQLRAGSAPVVGNVQ